MSRIAFIYPGQGAQVCGMGQDFYEQTETGKKVFDLATEILGFSLPELCFEKNDRLDITEYTQAAMVTTSIAMTKVLEENGVKPDVTAGLSLGEYCALYAAGVMSEKDAIATVRQRGILMQQAVPAGQGAMAAVLAMDAAVIEETIADINRKLAGIETILLFTEPELTCISSTTVRELLQFGKDISQFIPEGMEI